MATRVNPNLEQKRKTSVKYLHELNRLSFYRLQASASQSQTLHDKPQKIADM